ncbi:TadE/TadG family type IV pilus assembly protein [Arthrobacter sp. P2b]|uniref:TadE/TadG family type IV pilus assembly protein n=1 Tax=Arthrobacter sp. P2b TaxID=1938741 RepID=UPI0020CA357D|nr:TadE/TadG family type IV pilus assembly protein [Arthrobacter sp. P2b]
MKRKIPGTTENSRGAVAVEFALVAPILLLLVAGLIEFANVYNAQISVTQAAREAARAMAIHNNQATAELAAADGAPGLETAVFDYDFSPTACSSGSNIEVTINYEADSLTGLFGDTITLTGVGAMRCGG